MHATSRDRSSPAPGALAIEEPREAAPQSYQGTQGTGTEQATLRRPAFITGVGLHTGAEARLELRPAEPGAGLRFQRTDLPGEPAVPVEVASLGSLPRRTLLACGGVEVHTPEHLLAALHASGVSNLVIRIGGPEVPGMDGSALPFLEAIQGAGVVGQGAPGRRLEPPAPLCVVDGGASILFVPRPGGLRIEYLLDYSQWRLPGAAGGDARAAPGDVVRPIAPQYFELELTLESFAREIAPARTFVLEEEVALLRQAGLGKGANTRNTLVLGRDGVIDNSFRFPDELVRHKVLDLIGDLALVGGSLHGRVTAIKSGHAINARLAERIVRAADGTTLDGGASG